MLELFIGQSQLVWLVAPKIGEDRVRDTHQIVEHALPCRMLQIERHAALVSVQRLEVEAVTGHRVRRYGACHVTPDLRILDLDHFCAEICQMKGAEGPGAELRHS